MVMFSQTTRRVDSSKIPLTCRVSSLGRWSASTHLAGLVCAGQSVGVDATYFECCTAQGFERVVTETGGDCYRSCGLVERTFHLGELCSSLNSHGRVAALGSSLGIQTHEPSSVSRDQVIRAVERWRHLHAHTMVHGAKGRLVADVVTINGFVEDTHAGLASMIWHDSVIPLIHIHGSGVPQISKWIRELRKNASKGFRHVLTVECVQKLWDVSYLEELEQIITFASQTQTPLWLFLKQERDSSSENALPHDVVKQKSLKFQTAVNQKVDHYRRGPIEKWLSAVMLCRLEEVCELPIKKVKI